MTNSLQKKKILICGPSLNAVSGVSTHINQLYSSSIINSYLLTHFQLGSEGRSKNVVNTIFRLLTSPFLFFYSLIKHKSDVVHFNSSLDNAYWRDIIYIFVAKIMGKNIIYQVHGGALPDVFLGVSSLAQGFLRWSLGLADAIVLLATIEKQAYERFGNFKRLVVIPNAINLVEYNDVKAKKFNGDHLVVGYIGRYASDKGIIETIEALEKLYKKGNKGFIYKVAGAGPIESELKQLVIEKGLEANVTFMSPVFGAEKLAFWKNIDLFLFPTYHHEGLPYTILEALASGTPMITTTVGGIPDVIDNEKQGLFVEPHNVDELMLAIERLQIDKKLLQAMSKNCIERAHENYSVERLANQFLELYNDITK